jgi:hypothetical protein
MEALLNQEALVLILAALLAVSEVLALIPALKSNSVLQLVVNILKKAKEVLAPAPKNLLK